MKTYLFCITVSCLYLVNFISKYLEYFGSLYGGIVDGGLPRFYSSNCSSFVLVIAIGSEYIQIHLFAYVICGDSWVRASRLYKTARQGLWLVIVLRIYLFWITLDYIVWHSDLVFIWI